MSEDHQNAVRRAALAAAPAFHAAGWTWRDNEDPPSVDEIESTFWRLIGSVLQSSPGHSSATGRLNVYLSEEGDVHLSLDLGEVYGITARAEEDAHTSAMTGGEQSG